MKRAERSFPYELIVVLIASIIFLGSIISPPSLMDDVDATQAQISRNMIESGDWVTPHLDGVAYMEKPPLKYWIIAISFEIFGVHDWAARLPMALFAVGLCWLVTRMGAWAFSARAGFYAGLVLATCVGLYLFTRVLIPDIALTFTVALAMWAFLRTLEEDSKFWPLTFWAALASGLLMKGLIAAVFPIGTAIAYLAITRQFPWRRFRPLPGIALFLLIAAPWHVLATVRNPPYFAWVLHSGPGQYHGFFWFYFINEHVLRFLNLRYPRDYNTVPRVYFWLFHLIWLAPWSAFLPAVVRLNFRATDRAGRMRLLSLCWIGVVLIFFTFSSTQEYYSMPCYPALALLIGCAMLTGSGFLSYGRVVIYALAGVAATAIIVILSQVWRLPAPGDISQALTQHPDAYTLALGHMGDLTMQSFAYLKSPLVLAGIALLIGATGFLWRQPYYAIVAMMVLFIHAARLALVVFDPYLSSRPLANALLAAPPGQLIEDDAYYTFSSVFFYTNRRGLLLNGRKTNLEYGSYAPGAPKVFIDDAQLTSLWKEPQRYYLLVEGPSVPRIQAATGAANLYQVAESGGKFLFTNHAGAH